MSDCVLFDFDETLTRRDTTRLLVRAFWKTRPLRVLASAHHIHATRRARRNPERMQAAKFRMFGAFLKGLCPKDLAPIHQNYRKSVQHILRQSILERMRAHLDEGTTIVVVTASPRMAVEAALDDLPITVIGTEFELRNGRFTGRLVGAGCYGPAKPVAIAAWQSAQPQSMRIAEAWSDSWSDAPMMFLAERRLWVCPPGDPGRIGREDPAGIIYNEEAPTK